MHTECDWTMGCYKLPVRKVRTWDYAEWAYLCDEHYEYVKLVMPDKIVKDEPMEEGE